ncbi:hypothetical protein Golax_000517 [Gossypium laxum]|uniref:HD domain-containing protein n=1 Tax=Gossypium laxum TaxID=34288 RepID=A0A7J9ATY1_9ROSI|nr:hypothetical protein [Gossypium laxum]
MCKILGGGMRAAAEEIQELWVEYENNASLEANLVKDFDKVELILQALEYELGKGFHLFMVKNVKGLENYKKISDRDWKELGQRDQFKEEFNIGRKEEGT